MSINYLKKSAETATRKQRAAELEMQPIFVGREAAVMR